MSARLVLYPLGGAPRNVLLQRGTLTIGRDDGCNIQLQDSRVSGLHAKIRRTRHGKPWELVDAGSTNGTFVNGRQEEKVGLSPNNVLRFGDCLAVFEVGPFSGEGLDPNRSLASTVFEGEASKVSRLFASVLILGPTGAGKGFLARMIANSSERTGPFVHVNCAALPADLVESELFGHARGAFTGATQTKRGLIDQAHTGTLFLNEVSSLDAALQAKLLVAVEEGSIRPVGAVTDKSVDVRFIAATNDDIHEALSQGTFRRDLYFRLAAKTIRVPALQQRRADIIPILLNRLSLRDYGAFSGEALEALLNHNWPGNVRELLNVASTLELDVSDGIDYHALPEEMTAFLRGRFDGPRATPSDPSKPSRRELQRLLAEVSGNVSEVARRLGKHRNQVVRWLDSYGLRRR